MLYFFAAAALSSGVFGYGPGKLPFDEAEAETTIHEHANKTGHIEKKFQRETTNVIQSAFTLIQNSGSHLANVSMSRLCQFGGFKL